LTEDIVEKSGRQGLAPLRGRPDRGHAFGHEFVGIDKHRSDHVRLTVSKSENSVKR
jgi:hypothetical protein